MEVSISEVKQQLINRQPPVSHHLRAKNIYSHLEEKLFPFSLSYNRSMIGLFKLQHPPGSLC